MLSDLIYTSLKDSPICSSVLNSPWPLFVSRPSSEFSTMVWLRWWFPVFSICVSNTAYFLDKRNGMTFKSNMLAWLHTFLRVSSGL